MGIIIALYIFPRVKTFEVRERERKGKGKGRGKRKKEKKEKSSSCVHLKWG